MRIEYDLDKFHSSTSSFREYEEKGMRIMIQPTNDASMVFHTNNHDDMTLQHLILESFDQGKTIMYVPSAEDGLTREQRRFLTKLRLVLINNHLNSNVPHCEGFVDDLMMFLCEQAGMDDGLDLTMQTCYLRLSVGDEEFAAIADKEGRRGLELTWLLQEDKHRQSSSYKHGDVQLACAMIAAIQKNYNEFGMICPKIMMGLKCVGDTIYFCSMEPTQAYVEALYNGLPTTDEVVMYRFPERGFTLSIPDERKEGLKYLSMLRREAMK